MAVVGGGSEVEFTPLLGVEAGSPAAYLLRLGACTLLLDAGWDEDFNEGSLVRAACRLSQPPLHSIAADCKRQNSDQYGMDTELVMLVPSMHHR